MDTNAVWRRRRLGDRRLRRRSACVLVQRSKACTVLETDARLVNTRLAVWENAFWYRGAGCLENTRPFCFVITIVPASVLSALDVAVRLSMSYILVNEVLRRRY